MLLESKSRSVLIGLFKCEESEQRDVLPSCSELPSTVLSTGFYMVNQNLYWMSYLVSV